jgi:hypothetical protein
MIGSRKWLCHLSFDAKMTQMTRDQSFESFEVIWVTGQHWPHGISVCRATSHIKIKLYKRKKSAFFVLKIFSLVTVCFFCFLFIFYLEISFLISFFFLSFRSLVFQFTVKGTFLSFSFFSFHFCFSLLIFFLSFRSLSSSVLW